MMETTQFSVKAGLQALLIALAMTGHAFAAGDSEKKDAPPQSEPTATRGGSKVSISKNAQKLLEPIFKGIGDACGNGNAKTVTGSGFKCAKGNSAVPELQAQLKAQQDALNSAVKDTYREIPGPLQKIIAKECLAPALKDPTKSPNNCVEAVLTFKHPTSKPYKDAVEAQFPNYNQKRAVGLNRAVAKFEMQSAVLSAACYQAQGSSTFAGVTGCDAKGTVGTLGSLPQEAIAYNPYVDNGGAPSGSAGKPTTEVEDQKVPKFAKDGTGKSAPSGKDVAQGKNNPEGFDKANPDNLPTDGSRSSGRGQSLAKNTGGQNNGSSAANAFLKSIERDTRAALACPIQLDAAGKPCRASNGSPSANGAEAHDAVTEKLMFQSIANRQLREQIRGLARIASRPGLGEKMKPILSEMADSCGNGEMKNIIKAETASTFAKSDEENKKAGVTPEGANKRLVEAAQRLRALDEQNQSILKEFYDRDKSPEGNLESVEAWMNEGWKGYVLPCGGLVKGINRFTSFAKSLAKDESFNGKCEFKNVFGKRTISARGSRTAKSTVSCSAGTNSVAECMASCQSKTAGYRLTEADRHLRCQSLGDPSEVAAFGGSAQDAESAGDTYHSTSLIPPTSSQQDICEGYGNLLASNEVKHNAIVGSDLELSKVVNGQPLWKTLGVNSGKDGADIRKASETAQKELRAGVDDIKAMCADPEALAKRALADPAQVKDIFSCDGDDEDCKLLKRNASALCGYVGTAEHDKLMADMAGNLASSVMDKGFSAFGVGMDTVGCVFLVEGIAERLVSGVFRGASKAGAMALGQTLGKRMAARAGGAAVGAVDGAASSVVAFGASAVNEWKTLVPVGKYLARKATGAEARAALMQTLKNQKMFLGFTGYGVLSGVKGLTESGDAVKQLRASCITGDGSACSQLSQATAEHDDAAKKGLGDLLKFSILGAIVPGSLGNYKYSVGNKFAKALDSPQGRKYRDAVGVFKTDKRKFELATIRMNKALEPNSNVSKKDRDVAVAEFDKANAKFANSGKRVQEAGKGVLTDLNVVPKDANVTAADAVGMHDMLEHGDEIEAAVKTAKKDGKEITTDEVLALAGGNGRTMASDGKFEKPATELQTEGTEKFASAKSALQAAAASSPALAKALNSPKLVALIEAGSDNKSQVEGRIGDDQVLRDAKGEVGKLIKQLIAEKAFDGPNGKKTREAVNQLVFAHATAHDANYKNSGPSEVARVKNLSPEKLADFADQKEKVWDDNIVAAKKLEAEHPELFKMEAEGGRKPSEMIREEGVAARKIWDKLTDPNGSYKLAADVARCFFGRIAAFCPKDFGECQSIINQCKAKHARSERQFFESPASYLADRESPAAFDLESLFN